jgi:hypothetical protein
MLSSTSVMDRGTPTEEVLEEMRTLGSDHAIFCLVGTPRSRVRQYEKKWLDLPWQKVRESVEVKLFAEAGELYVLAKSEGRRAKERAMRRRKLARLLVRGPHNVANNSPLLRLHSDCFAWVSMRVGFVPIDPSNRPESNFSSASPPATPLRSNKGRDAKWKQGITETPTG